MRERRNKQFIVNRRAVDEAEAYLLSLHDKERQQREFYSLSDELETFIFEEITMVLQSYYPRTFHRAKGAEGQSERSSRDMNLKNDLLNLTTYFKNIHDTIAKINTPFVEETVNDAYTFRRILEEWSATFRDKMPQSSILSGTRPGSVDGI